MVPQAQPAISRPTRLFLRQLRASHLGSELEGESQKQLGDCQGSGCRSSLPFYQGCGFFIPRWLQIFDLSIV